jgi:hypothetical protein
MVQDVFHSIQSLRTAKKNDVDLIHFVPPKFRVAMGYSPAAMDQGEMIVRYISAAMRDLQGADRFAQGDPCGNLDLVPALNSSHENGEEFEQEFSVGQQDEDREEGPHQGSGG